MNLFIRVTKLSNIVGRADYISNTKRQENIVINSDPIDWKPYQDFERSNKKTNTNNNEGREIIIALPNEWSNLNTQELKEKANELAITATGKSTDTQWAIHWNKTHTNLHIHIIFSERTKEKNIGKWDRDIYLTDEGKIARKKSDRAKNPDGTIKPPIHRKGEEKGGFTSKDIKYKDHNWLDKLKKQIKEKFIYFGVNIEENNTFHQYHEGKGNESYIINKKNECIKLNNKLWNEYIVMYGAIPVQSFKKLMIETIKENKLLFLNKINDKLYYEKFNVNDLNLIHSNYGNKIKSLNYNIKLLSKDLIRISEDFKNLKQEFILAKFNELKFKSEVSKYNIITGFLHKSDKERALNLYNKAKVRSNFLGKNLSKGVFFNTIQQREEFINYPLKDNKQLSSVFLKICNRHLYILEKIYNETLKFISITSDLNNLKEYINNINYQFKKLNNELPNEYKKLTKKILDISIDLIKQKSNFKEPQLLKPSILGDLSRYSKIIKNNKNKKMHKDIERSR